MYTCIHIYIHSCVCMYAYILMTDTSYSRTYPKCNDRDHPSAPVAGVSRTQRPETVASRMKSRSLSTEFIAGF